MLLDQLISLLEGCFAKVFATKRSRNRAMALALGTLCAMGRRTLSRSICAAGRQNRDWSADYKLYSRSSWQADSLFDPVFEDYRSRFDRGPFVIAFDDTKLHKTGRHIRSAFWQKDPLSPPFHVNLLFGLRFMQASLIFPHYREGDFPPRAIPVRFRECPALKKPGKKATEEEREAYRKAIKTENLPSRGMELIKELRDHLDLIGESHRPLLVPVDGSLCNRTVFRTPLERTEVVARCRKDAGLCLPAPVGSRRKYSEETFSPEKIRQSEAIDWRETAIFFGGAWRTTRYKLVEDVLWRRGAGTRKLRLFVVAPQPYRVSPRARLRYRQPAYLLCTDCLSDPAMLLQAYFDRWQIEVNHREEKDTLGVGQAQVRSPESVPRQPAFAVAAYSLLLLAALRQFGPGRPLDCVALPKWRKKSRRPSALDLVTLLRREIQNKSRLDLPAKIISENLIGYACA